MDGETLELESLELEVESPEIEGAEPELETPEVEQPETEHPDSPYTTKFSREMRAAIKALEQQHPEQAKYLKHLRDQHARQFALNQIEPEGIDGVREKYAMLDGLVRGDAKGAQALTAIQEELAGVEEIDNLIASGDPRAFELLGDEIVGGLAKLAPAYLDRVKAQDPAAFEAAITPHVVATLAGSDVLKAFNDLVDVLNTKDDPRLDDAAKYKYVFTALAKMAEGFNGLQAKAGQTKAPTQQADPLQDRQSTLEKQEQDFHWNTKIQPSAVQHENQTFESLLKPYQMRLKLDATAQTDLLQAFKSGLNRAGSSDAEYLRQMKLYRGQKNPDPTAVANFVKNAINKHSKSVMESIIKARYGAFLAGKPKTQATVAKPGVKSGPVAPNVEIRSVKPPMNEIDHRNTPVEWLAAKKYRLYSGKVVQVRSN